MEDINNWVTTIASWITLIGTAAKVGKWLMPKIRESLRIWRSCRRKH